ncbi:MAG: hypothetical protein ABR956_08140 [Terracidiphilus sp.]|jgi:hypothetical protein
MKEFRALISNQLTRLLALAVLASLAGVCCAQASDQNPMEIATRLMRQQIGLDAAAPTVKNPDGLKIKFSRIGDVQLPDGNFVRYRLLIPGAPEKQGYNLAIWRIGAKVKISNSLVYVNAKGLVMSHLPNPDQENNDSLQKPDEIEVDLDAARGEPIRYMLSSPDGRFFFPGTIVLHPIEAKDGKCRLEARLGLPEGQFVLLYGDGLTPFSHVPVQAVSEGETHTPIMTVDAQGHGVASIAPYVAGKETGTAKISLATTGCSVSVDVPWGKGTYHRY